ncbi:hypothetical protein Sd1_gp61 [Shigella phage Sd1]|uniref:Uncharacterized protein n=1 Tax=Shigella phage Sd1 TaxID=2024313 RepID=A0A291AYL2_9CAUD|nr:hypothetical protein HOR98_gp67 [Shigella phage Sd1]ATE86127.1 hypothetical protein Sd1_gp61 [Shigella phage Sd1]
MANTVIFTLMNASNYMKDMASQLGAMEMSLVSAFLKSVRIDI